MGIDPASLLLEATSAIGSGTAAAGATAAAGGIASATTAASIAAEAAAVGDGSLLGLGSLQGLAQGAAAAGAYAGGASAATSVAAAIAPPVAHAGLSSSVLTSLGSASVNSLLGGALTPKPPKPGQAPQPPNLFGANKGSLSLLNNTTGDSGGTFITGNNKAPQIAGGKKTLLGS